MCAHACVRVCACMCPREHGCVFIDERVHGCMDVHAHAGVCGWCM